mmetsp:Transcript_30869/g.89646  ORF Transcript_30869/g.89646 Transcript_30869/m.89646 type:complete len:252 (-) Transcript_30869:1025-1780(-)
MFGVCVDCISHSDWWSPAPQGKGFVAISWRHGASSCTPSSSPAAPQFVVSSLASFVAVPPACHLFEAGCASPPRESLVLPPLLPLPPPAPSHSAASSPAACARALLAWETGLLGPACACAPSPQGLSPPAPSHSTASSPAACVRALLAWEAGWLGPARACALAPQGLPPRHPAAAWRVACAPVLLEPSCCVLGAACACAPPTQGLPPPAPPPPGLPRPARVHRAGGLPQPGLEGQQWRPSVGPRWRVSSGR